MVLSFTQVVCYTLAFFLMVAAVGFWLALSARRLDSSEREEKPSQVDYDRQAALKVQQFEGEIKERMRDFDAYVAHARAEIDKQVASVR